MGRIALPGLMVVFAVLPAEGQVATAPAREENNLIVAAYNIQWVGQKRHDYDKLIKVIQHFDVCGIIEIKKEKSMPDLVKRLEALTGKKWGFVYGVRTHLPPSRYHEAFGVLWRRDRVELSGLVGGMWDKKEKFRNDPYIASFRRKNFDFTMILLHTRWDSGATENRKAEVIEIADQVNWMQGFQDERDIIIAGDFNYSGTNDAMKQMKERAGLIQLDKDPKSTFKTNGSGFASAYDHMFVLEDETTEFVPNSCNTLDVCKLVYGNNEAASMKKARRELSDHLPVFSVFRVDGEDDD